MALYINPNTGVSTEDPNNGVLLDTYNPTQAPTAGEVYGGVVNETAEEKAARLAVEGNASADANMVINEDEIRNKTTQKFQAEIDALNNIYADKLRVANTEGQGRLGETGAIQARRGLLGSDFGASMTEGTRTFNNQIVSGIEAEKSSKRSAIEKQIRDSVTSEVELKTAAKKLGAENYLKFLRESGDRKKTYVTDTIKKIVASGEKPSEGIFKSIADQLGTSIEDVKANYKEQETAYRTALEKSELEKKQAEADIAYKTTQTDQFGVDNQFKKTEQEMAKEKQDFEKSITTGEFNLKKSEYANKITQQAFDNKLSLDELQLKREQFASDDDYKNASLILEQMKLNAKELEESGNVEIKKVDGKDYQVKDGKLIPVELPPEELKQATELQKQAGINAKNLLNNLGNASLGLGRAAMKQFVPGSAQKNWDVDFKSFIAQLQLDSAKYLKGQGQITESERQILREASTGGLDTGIDKATFKKKLQDLVTVLGDPGELQIKDDGTYIYKNINGTVHKGQQGDNYVDKTVPDADLSFSMVGGDTNKAIIEKVAKKEDGEKGGQCGRFVNKLTGLGVGDSYQSKMAKMDPTIKKPEPGMVFTMPYKQYGHIGIIVGINGDKAVVKDSNYDLDEKVKTHEIPISKMTGFARV
jgi:hypothetical protein